MSDTLPPTSAPGPVADRAARLARLDAVIERLIRQVETLPSPDRMVDTQWTACDVVGHLAFWHESFARNVGDLVHGRVPTPVRGRLPDLNDRGVAEMRGVPFKDVVRRLGAAQATVRAEILAPGIEFIPYGVGSRPYTPDEHLDIVHDHVAAHPRGLDRP